MLSIGQSNVLPALAASYEGFVQVIKGIRAASFIPTQKSLNHKSHFVRHKVDQTVALPHHKHRL